MWPWPIIQLVLQSTVAFWDEKCVFVNIRKTKDRLYLFSKDLLARREKELGTCDVSQFSLKLFSGFG